jgi:geranylgeranyl pyrophosphate synthase
LWARHGAAQAINAGDLCIALGYAAIGAVPVDDATRWQLTSTMTAAARRIVSGQADELGLLAANLPSWADYAACVEGKTSALFALPIEGAALIAGRARAEAAALADACRPLGLLFQIQDDILDLYGDNGRDRPGSDLAQAGKATAFVVEHLRLHPGDAAWLIAILTAPREETAQADIDEAIRRFAAGGALAAVWRRIDDIRAALAASPVLARERTVALLMRHFVETALAPVAHTRPGPG